MGKTIASREGGPNQRLQARFSFFLGGTGSTSQEGGGSFLGERVRCFRQDVHDIRRTYDRSSHELGVGFITSDSCGK